MVFLIHDPNLCDYKLDEAKYDRNTIDYIR